MFPSSIDTKIVPENKRSEQINSSTWIYGNAAPGTAESEAKWQIYKIVDTGTSFTQTYADGNPHYDNIWANYLTQVFS